MLGYVILSLMMKKRDTQSLIKAIKLRGWQDATGSLLDIIEPTLLISAFVHNLSLFDAETFVRELAIG